MSIQKKFKAGDKVVWDDFGYWNTFFTHTDPEQILTVSHYGDEDDGEAGLVFFENLSDINGDQAGVFDHRFTLVESAQESNGTPSIQGETCSQNCVSCKDKQTHTLEDKDENEWFKRGELPTVGTVCECQNNSMQWLKGTIVYVVEDKGTTLAIMQTPTEILYGEAGEFRPIQSPEQIAKQEREAYCDRIYSVLCKAERKNNRSDMAEALYDAGLRFVGEGVQHGN